MSTMARRIRNIFFWIIGVIAALVLVLFCYVSLRWDAPVDRPVQSLTAPRDTASIARGEYIFKYQAQCWGCHATEGASASSAPSGGTLFDLSNVGPGFGVWHSRNITPDMETGIGSWTDGEIVRAIREGIRKDGTVMFPLMPVDWYHGISDADVLSIVAYLRSIPPVSNRVTPQSPSFFAKALFTLGVLAPKPPIVGPVIAPPKGLTAEYGRYVASNLSGCMDCHTPRNLADGSFFLDSLGAGSTIRFGEEAGAPLSAYARNITPDKETGIGSWSEEQFLAAVTYGTRSNGEVLTPHMPYAYYKSCTEEDLRAIYIYLQSLPAIRRTTAGVSASPKLTAAKGAERGGLLFAARCQACHGARGGGSAPTSVILAEVSPSMSDAELRETIQTGAPNLKMPSFVSTLPGSDIDDLIAFIRTWEQK